LKIFIDTWGWLVLGDEKEERHKQVKDWYSSFRNEGGVAYTSDYVLDETITLLFRRVPFQQALGALEVIDQSVKMGYLVVEWIDSKRFNGARVLRRKFSDKPNISFTDLTSMVIMRELGISDVLTEDDHFIQVGMGLKKVP